MDLHPYQYVSRNYPKLLRRDYIANYVGSMTHGPPGFREEIVQMCEKELGQRFRCSPEIKRAYHEFGSRKRATLSWDQISSTFA